MRTAIQARLVFRAMTLMSAVAFVFSGAACSEATAPQPGPPYLAIVTNLSLLPGVVAPATISYHVTELSGTLGVDKKVSVPPGDTVVIPVSPATYVVEIEGVPATCFIKDGNNRAIVVSKLDNTGIVRYQVQCRGALSIETATDGYDPDPHFIYRIQQDSGTLERLGAIGGNDTLVFNDVPAGRYTVQLAGIAPNCVVTSDGGAQQTVSVDTAGGVMVGFRIRCARESERPKILSVKSSYVLGASVFIVKVYDPNRDIEGYAWDLSDCHQNSIFSEKRERIRRGLSTGRGRLQDTLTIVGAYDVGLPPDALRNRCTKIRVFDYEDNSSDIVEHRIGSATGIAPQPTAFNAKLVGTQYVETLLGINDPDGDFGGFFVAVRLRDGTIGPSDGTADLGIMDPAGYVLLPVPNLRTDGRLRWDDVYAVIVWAIDAAGNAIRLEDADVFR